MAHIAEVVLGLFWIFILMLIGTRANLLLGDSVRVITIVLLVDCELLRLQILQSLFFLSVAQANVTSIVFKDAVNL